MPQPSEKITVAEFEKQVWKIESIRVVVRAPGKTAVGSYNMKKAANAKWRYSQLEGRLAGYLGDFEFVITDGTGNIPGRNMSLQRIRESYHSA